MSCLLRVTFFFRNILDLQYWPCQALVRRALDQQLDRGATNRKTDQRDKSCVVHFTEDIHKPVRPLSLKKNRHF